MWVTAFSLANQYIRVDIKARDVMKAVWESCILLTIRNIGIRHKAPLTALTEANAIRRSLATARAILLRKTYSAYPGGCG